MGKQSFLYPPALSAADIPLFVIATGAAGQTAAPAEQAYLGGTAVSSKSPKMPMKSTLFPI